MTRLTELKRKLIELEGLRVEEDYPGQVDEHRRQLILEAAVAAADEIIIQGANATEEEIDFLTSLVAQKFAEKVHCSLTARLLRKQLEQQAQRRCENGVSVAE